MGGSGHARLRPPRPIKTVGIIGAGTMGGGIAMNFATAGITVSGSSKPRKRRWIAV